MGESVGQKVSGAPERVTATPPAPDRVAEKGGSFSGAVRDMFNAVAPRYDSFNHWASLGLDYGWRRAAVRALELEPRSKVLDVATGTGDLAFAAARKAAGAVGCDFAAEMIYLARDKSRGLARDKSRGDLARDKSRGDLARDKSRGLARDKSRGAGNVSFHVARAEQLPYVANHFDGVTSAFAMRNVKPMLAEVLAEAFRVLRPGGRVAILEFSRPRVAPVRWSHGLYTRTVMPRVGRLLTGTSTPFEYLYRSIQEWDAPEEFADRLRRAGFADVGYRMMGLGTVALHVGRRPPHR